MTPGRGTHTVGFNHLQDAGGRRLFFKAVFVGSRRRLNKFSEPTLAIRYCSHLIYRERLWILLKIQIRELAQEEYPWLEAQDEFERS